MPTYRLDRKSRRKLAALWKPAYDTLATFNTWKAYNEGCLHTPQPERQEVFGRLVTPEFEARMAEVQRDYDENYLPASNEIWDEGKQRRCWFG